MGESKGLHSPARGALPQPRSAEAGAPNHVAVYRVPFAAKRFPSRRAFVPQVTTRTAGEASTSCRAERFISEGAGNGRQRRPAAIRTTQRCMVAGPIEVARGLFGDRAVRIAARNSSADQALRSCGDPVVAWACHFNMQFATAHLQRATRAMGYRRASSTSPGAATRAPPAGGIWRRR